MEIVIDTSSRKENFEDAICHHIPCHIDHVGEAAVDTFFTPCIRSHPDNAGILCASFRGFPLRGQKLTVPVGYEGVVLKEVGEHLSDQQENRNLQVVGQFKSFTYWNWDRLPSKNDKIVQTKDWIDIAEALHKPVGIEDEASDAGTILTTPEEK